MLTPSSDSTEDFLEVYHLYDWDKFHLDLLRGNAGEGLSPQEERCLRAIALDLERQQIAEKLSIQSSTVRDYLRKPYELIKVLFDVEGRMTEKKARSLILSKYKQSKLNSSTFIQEFAFDHEVENGNLEGAISVNELVWSTLNEIQPFVDKFHELCEIEAYVEAFYVIFETDGYENSIYKFLSSYGYLNTIISVYEKLSETWNPRKSEKWEFLTMLACLGDACDRMGDHKKAIDYYLNCLNMAIEIDDVDNIGGSLVNLGLTYYWLRDYEEAIDCSRRGLEVAREIGNREFESHALNNLGLIYSDLKEYRLAIDYYHFSLEVTFNSDGFLDDGGSLINIGDAYRKLEQYEQALSYLQRGIETAHQNHHKQFEANGWFNLALALESLTQYSDALSAYEKAQALYQEMEMFDHLKNSEEAICSLREILDHDT
ncbi:MAG: tetratricopeptide repeat protein [Leptolyngbyaceae cyanobacterium bins.302]|nr:tetratricopeptide repeat protein [Leptolyngbyaceae cyanobacterium bins.302]